MTNEKSVKATSTRQALFAVLLVIVLILAAWVRFFNIGWDQGTHLHPDERYLTMVASAIRFPSELSAGNRNALCSSSNTCLNLYWNSRQSPLNPANYDQYANYVYGTIPLFLTRATGSLLDTACSITGDMTHPSLMRYFATGLRQLVLGTNEPCYQGHYTGYGGLHLVGRALSALADLCTLTGLVLMTRALYGDRTAILAGLLYAFAVLPIQHAHFFVVDSFATVFVVWSLYFCVMAYQRHTPLFLIGAGIFTGLAVASKISVWPLAGIVGLTGLFLYINDAPVPESDRLNQSFAIIFTLMLSGLCAAIAFRVGQPYAFEGPGFFDVKLNPNWLITMKDIRELMSGARDVPFGHQWANRMPVVFPFRNMIFWGLGIPLGLTAWIGWGTLGWQIWKKVQFENAILWTWATVFFFYQSTQWVKSMRYLLPIYPVFAILAAWVLV
ncbi:MAG: glycosyltransferase family 39 protein, partial [Anaerolineae bacterium]|nr:glycosyltransferase family 39 protein [Anaerolineae bacterium]